MNENDLLSPTPVLTEETVEEPATEEPKAE